VLETFDGQAEYFRELFYAHGFPGEKIIRDGED
jgi:hypothetical protein